MGNEKVQSKQQSIIKRWVNIVISIAIIALFYFLPIDTESLSFEGRMALGILVSAVYAWITQPIPLAATALAAMMIMPLFNVLPLSDVWTSWVSSVIFFCLAAFALSAAIIKSKLPAKIVFALMKMANGKSAGVVLSFMITATIVSAFVSNIPVTAVFCALAMSTVLELEKAKPGESQLGRCLMIGIVFGSMLGGMCTPVGNAMNIMVMGMLTGSTGITISFFQWVALALPIVIVVLPVSWFVLIKMFKPEPLSEATQQELANRAKESGKLGAADYKVLAVFVLLVVLWLVSAWTQWDATAICILGMIILFLPGVDVLTWKEYVDNVAWDIILVIGSVSSLATGVNKQGAANWLISKTVSAVGLTAGSLTAAAAGFLPIIRLIVPVAPALIALVTMPFLGLAQAVGLNAVVMAMIIALEINTFLLALDNNTMMSFRYGYFSIIQYFFAGIVPTLIIFGMCCTVLPAMVGVVGL